ncbi:MAG: cyclic nucleotide-binding domain-containing protein [Myxococcota bacterium]
MAATTRELHEKADTAARSGDFWNALRHAGDALNADPHDHRARTKLALSLSALGQSEAAIETLRVGAEALNATGYPLTALAMVRDAIALGGEDFDDLLDAIHAAGRGSELSARPRIPPPIPPARTVDLEPLRQTDGREAALQAAIELGHGAPPPLAAPPPRALPFFSEMELPAFRELVARMTTRKLLAGEVVVEEGDGGDALFVIVRGEVDVEQQGHLRARLGAGAFFGEMALFIDKPRNATVRTHQATELFEIHRSDIEALAISHPSLTEDLAHFARRRMVQNVVATSPIFEPFSTERRRQILSAFQARVVEPGQVVISEGDPGSGLYVVMAGEMEVSTQDDGEPVVVAYLESGEVFGEISLIRGDHAMATVTAVDRSHLLFLPRRDFEAVAELVPEARRLLDALAERRLEELEAVRSQDIVLDADDLVLV